MKKLQKTMKGLGVLLLCAALLGLVACSNDNGVSPNKGEDGPYNKTVPGHLGDINVKIEVVDGELADVVVTATSETAGLGQAAAAYLQELIKTSKSVDFSPECVSGASTTGGAVLAAARDCFAQAGLVSREYTPPDPVTLDSNYDVVVVGGGASGFAATMAAWEKGAKVLVLEQTGQTGGLSLTAFGILGAGSQQQQNAHDLPFGMGTNQSLTASELAAVSVDALFEWINNKYNHFRSNSNLVQAILAKSGSTIDWLNANGIQTVVLKGVDQGLHVDYPKTYHMWGAFNFGPVNSFTTQWNKMQGKMLDPEWDSASGEPTRWVAATTPTNNPIQVEFFTRGKSLVMEGNTVKEVKAVRANGQEVTVKAKQVILTTGGYGADRTRFMERTEINYYNYFGYGNHGDGIKMAQEIGADPFNDHIIQIHMADPAGTPAIGSANIYSSGVSAVTDLPHLWVDTAGNRFVDETAVYDNVFWGNAAFSVGGKYYIIFDQATIDKLIADGSPYLGGYGVAGVGYFDFAGNGNFLNGFVSSYGYATPSSHPSGTGAGQYDYTKYPLYNPGITGTDGDGFLLDASGNKIPKVFWGGIAPVTDLQDNLNTFVQNRSSVAFRGTNVDDLVSKIRAAGDVGMDAAKLKATIAKYNTAVQTKSSPTGGDTQFFKDKKFLTWEVNPNSTIYAIAMQGSTYGSIGGVRVNESIQALNSYNAPFSNLYVGGADAGGMWDSSYPDLEGLSQSFAMNSGRIAGENAAKAAGY